MTVVVFKFLKVLCKLHFIFFVIDLIFINMLSLEFFLLRLFFNSYQCHCLEWNLTHRRKFCGRSLLKCVILHLESRMIIEPGSKKIIIKRCTSNIKTFERPVCHLCLSLSRIARWICVITRWNFNSGLILQTAILQKMYLRSMVKIDT